MKAKKIIYVIIIIISSNISFAQEKYMFMQITYHNYSNMHISVDGTEYKSEVVDPPKGERYYNANPLIQKIKEYQDAGWELTSREMISSTTYIAFNAYLRKKK